LIRPHIRRTAVIEVNGRDFGLADVTLVFKLELLQQAGALDELLVAVGGGGLIGGIAAWFGDRLKVIGVEPELAPTVTRALEAGRPVDAPAGGIAADSLAPRRVGDRVFPIVQRYVKQVALVTDVSIARAQQALWRTLRIAAEPGGAAAFAALLSGRVQPRAGSRIAVIISGGNTSAVNFAESAPDDASARMKSVVARPPAVARE
jgi:threonine dehydratase